MESLRTQCARAMKMIETRQTNIDKYLYLSSIKAENTDLFYRLVMDNIRDLMPLVYTPTIGDVCLQYSTLYTRPEALYISIKQRRSIRTMLRNWPCLNPEICVVTDGSRILGLGDLGINGVGISVSPPVPDPPPRRCLPCRRGVAQRWARGKQPWLTLAPCRLASSPCTRLLPASTRKRRFP